jgi:uncharacterized protein
MRPLKDVGLVLAGIAGFLALVFLMGLYIEGLTWASENLQEYLNIAAKIALAVCVFILLPCALFPPTRIISVFGLLISSVIFGASTWTLGFLVTLHYWGTMGVFVGIFMGVVGIVPLGMLASLFNGDWYAIGILVFGLALTFGARIIAIMLAAWIDRDKAGINPNSPSLSLAPQPSKRALVTVLGLVLVGSVGVWLVETQRPITEDPWIAAMNRRDYAAALRLIRPLANQGEASGQNTLGVMYFYGDGVPQDYAEAVKWYRKAADQGEAGAQSNLAGMYEDGDGVPQNYAEALKWYRLAADQGNAVAQSNLGLMYSNGNGVAQNNAEAVKWYRLAADQGEASGQNRLGVMYFYGNGVPQNYVEAAKWYRLAADQGDATAQSNLGLIYYNGNGVPQDYVRAHMWFNLSAAQGEQDAIKYRDDVTLKMAPAQLAEAQKLAREWKPKSTRR